jgi:hypothetical protein
MVLVLNIAYKLVKTVGALAAGYMVGVSLFSDGQPAMPVRIVYNGLTYGVMGWVYYRPQKPFWPQVILVLLPGWVFGLFFGGGDWGVVCLAAISGCAIGAAFLDRVLSASVDAKRRWVAGVVDTAIVAAGCTVLIVSLGGVMWVFAGISALALIVKLMMRHLRGSPEAKPMATPSLS